MTYLALNLSRYVNGVAKRHGEVSRNMFEGHKIDFITNGVHAANGYLILSEPLRSHMQGWKEDNFSLPYALNIPEDDLSKAHRRRNMI
jgi:starch phosphorylase